MNTNYEDQFYKLSRLLSTTYSQVDRDKILDAMLPHGDYNQLLTLRNSIFNSAECDKILDAMLPKGTYDQLLRLRNNTFNSAECDKILAFMLKHSGKKHPAPTEPSIPKRAYSCFICYGEPDIAFAEKLRNALNTKQIQTWMYVMDYTPGNRTWKEIIENRRASNKFLVICSTASLSRDGVLKEIEQQIDENPDKIIPVSKDLGWTEPSFIVKRGISDLKPFLRERNYADFATKPFNEALDRLADAIKQST